MRSAFRTLPFLLAVATWVLSAGARPCAADDGGTMWGDDYNATVRAMKKVTRAIGVKTCLHCHVKTGGSVDYEVDTPHKQIARQMKIAFVDSLVANGGGEVTLVEDGRTRVIRTIYRPKGEDAGIDIVVTQPAAKKGGEPSSWQTRLNLPEDGLVDCATCHNGKLHFVTEK